MQEVEEEEKMKYLIGKHELFLEVTNVVCTSKLPVKLRLTYPGGFGHFIKHSRKYAQIKNETCSPILSIGFVVPVKDKRDRRISVSLWSSGAINVVGVLSEREAFDYICKVVIEIERVLKIKRGS